MRHKVRLPADVLAKVVEAHRALGAVLDAARGEPAAMPAEARSWDEVPLIVRSVREAAMILNRSTSSIFRDLASGRMTPAPQRVGRTWVWSKAALQRHVERLGR